jgi:hypothetical protein
MTRCSGELPAALLPTGVIVGPVRAGHLTKRSLNLLSTPSYTHTYASLPQVHPPTHTDMHILHTGTPSYTHTYASLPQVHPPTHTDMHILHTGTPSYTHTYASLPQVHPPTHTHMHHYTQVHPPTHTYMHHYTQVHPPTHTNMHILHRYTLLHTNMHILPRYTFGSYHHCVGVTHCVTYLPCSRACSRAA